MGLREMITGKGPKEDAGSPGEAKYSGACALCSGTGTEKKWMGQYWHKKCMRQAKKGAKKMI